MARPRRYKRTSQETVVPSAARTTSSQSSGVLGWNRGVAAVSKLDVTAASGTPNLVVVIEDSPDNATWTVRDTYPAKTGISNETRALPTTLDVFQRVRWTITGGTPNITFSVQFASSAASLL